MRFLGKACLYVVPRVFIPSKKLFGASFVRSTLRMAALQDWLGLNKAQPAESASNFLSASRRSIAQSSHEAGMPDLELQPGRDGAALELTERQQRLIQLQHPDAARVIVTELHGGASAAALERPSRRVLQTVGLDGSGQPAEPTLTKLDAAAALAEEVARHDAVGKTLGSYAGRILRRPLYLRDARIAAAGEFSAAEHGSDADAALVLELPDACWALPEFSGASTGRQIIAPLQVQLCEAVAAGKASDCATIDETLDELCAATLPPATRHRHPACHPHPPTRSSTT